MKTLKPLENFDRFWQIYPRKTDKKKARVAFARLSKVKQDRCILGAGFQAVHNPQWKDPSLIPYPTTFIHGDRWDDEITESKNANARVQENQNKSAVEMVWSAFSQMWPLSFTSKYGEKPMAVWRSQLSKIPEARILRGLRYALNSKAEFPPPLPVFLGYCSQTFNETLPALPARRISDKETALDFLAAAYKATRL